MSNTEIKQKKHVQLGTQIAKAVKQSGKKQVEFARLLNIPASNLSRWINGEVAPSYEYIIKICNLSGVTLDWLLLGKESMQVVKIVKEDFVYSPLSDNTIKIKITLEIERQISS